MNLLVNVRLFRICVGVTGGRASARAGCGNMKDSLYATCCRPRPASAAVLKAFFQPQWTLLWLSLNLKPALLFGGENAGCSEALSRPLCQ